MNTQHGALPPNNSPEDHLPWEEVFRIAKARAQMRGLSECDAQNVASMVTWDAFRNAEKCRKAGRDVISKTESALYVELPDGSWACANNVGALNTLTDLKILEYRRSNRRWNDRNRKESARAAAVNPGPSSSEALGEKEEVKGVQDALEKANLTKQERTVLILRSQGWTWHDISSDLGVPTWKASRLGQDAKAKVLRYLFPDPIPRREKSNATSAETGPGAGKTLDPVIETVPRAPGDGFWGAHAPTRQSARPFNQTQSTSIESRPGQGGQQ